MDTALAISYIVPDARFIGSVINNTEEEYNAIRWRDNRPQPTWAELAAAYNNAVGDYKDEQLNNHSIPVAVIQDRKLSWQHSGTWTAWGWRTHDLTHVELNNIEGLVLNNHRITIPNGVYRIDFYAMAYRVDKFIYRMYDVSKDDNTPLIESLTGYSRNHNNGDQNMTSYGSGVVLIDSSDNSTQLELQGYAQNTWNNDGFGLRRNLGDVGGYNPDNIYAQINIQKLG